MPEPHAPGIGVTKSGEKGRRGRRAQAMTQQRRSAQCRRSGMTGRERRRREGGRWGGQVKIRQTCEGKTYGSNNNRPAENVGLVHRQVLNALNLLLREVLNLLRAGRRRRGSGAECARERTGREKRGRRVKRVTRVTKIEGSRTRSAAGERRRIAACDGDEARQGGGGAMGE